MKFQHHVTIGLFNPKTPENMGAVLRAAGCFGVDAVVYTGTRYERAKKFSGDTKSAIQRIPVTRVEDLLIAAPPSATIVAVEMTEGAIPLMSFQHPAHAFYLFGPEDHSLPQDLLDHCDAVVYVPTIGCMNLAASVNVLLYDRLAKSQGNEIAERPVIVNRDNRNRTIVRSGQTRQTGQTGQTPCSIDDITF
jgi:tRNA(Leu) C34 or U34 (ribose-2'-O)-methylase TrmL